MRCTFRSLALAAALIITASVASAQSNWRSCDDGNKACQAFCDNNKPGDKMCTGDCFGRMKQCRETTYYPWGADGKKLIGPLSVTTQTSSKP